jgi:outer membrane biosynthesis protein TonB
MKLLRFFAAVIGCCLAFQAFALPQNDAAQPKRLRIEPKEAAGLLTHSVEPKYPESARADHVTGDVFLRIVIDRQGKVIEAAPVSRDEWPSNAAFTEDPRLRDAAMDAVKQQEYKPYLLNGEPVEVESRVVVKVHPSVIDSGSGGGLGGGGVIGGVPGGVIGGIIGSSAPPLRVATPQKLRVSSQALESNLLKHVDPVYPGILPNAPMRAEVRLLAMIGKTGDIVNLRAISGHPILIQTAMDAVREWKYKPFLVNGEPVEAEGEVIVVFKR